MSEMTMLIVGVISGLAIALALILLARHMARNADRRYFLVAMRYLLYDHEPETLEEVDAFLRSEGLDPGVIAADGKAFAQKALDAQRSRMEKEM